MLAVPNDLNIGRIAGIAQKHLRVAAEISAPAVDLVNLISGHQSGRTGLRDLRRQVRYAVYRNAYNRKGMFLGSLTRKREDKTPVFVQHPTLRDRLRER